MTGGSDATAHHADEQELAEQLIEQCRTEIIEVIGPGGLLGGPTSRVINSAFEVEMIDHLGYDKRDPSGRNGESPRDDNRSKTVTTEVGPVRVKVPWDRDGGFDPLIVRKRQCGCDGSMSLCCR